MCWGKLWYCVLVYLDFCGYVGYDWVNLGKLTGDWVFKSKCSDVVVSFCMLCKLLDILEFYKDLTVLLSSPDKQSFQMTVLFNSDIFRVNLWLQSHCIFYYYYYYYFDVASSWGFLRLPWSFLVPPRAFRHFLILPYSSNCFLLLVDYPWQFFFMHSVQDCHNIKIITRYSSRIAPINDANHMKTNNTQFYWPCMVQEISRKKWLLLEVICAVEIVTLNRYPVVTRYI